MVDREASSVLLQDLMVFNRQPRTSILLLYVSLSLMPQRLVSSVFIGRHRTAKHPTQDVELGLRGSSLNPAFRYLSSRSANHWHACRSVCNCNAPSTILLGHVEGNHTEQPLGLILVMHEPDWTRDRITETRGLLPTLAEAEHRTTRLLLLLGIILYSGGMLTCSIAKVSWPWAVLRSLYSWIARNASAKSNAKARRDHRQRVQKGGAT